MCEPYSSTLGEALTYGVRDRCWELGSDEFLMRLSSQSAGAKTDTGTPLQCWGAGALV